MVDCDDGLYWQEMVGLWMREPDLKYVNIARMFRFWD